ncbi:MAG: GTPase ObgE [Candidatus Omnitrophica bacterium]|nr:GTPase ObgE [Candidatus Omnitrophota bacterium]
MAKFIDEAKIWVKAGDGGNGCVAFRREKFVPRGGPSGGDGGRGADIIFTAEKNIHTLIDFHYKKHFSAESGGHGSGKNKEGKSGKNLVIPLPVGTVIEEIKESGNLFLTDLAHDGASFIAAEGGKGGRGNAFFKSSTNQAPRTATKGAPGQERYLKLELKLLADVGIIGYPNSGKSTLISKVSSAKPKIADYPFTTVAPNLGVVRLGEGRSFVVADIPGLIEGASEGKGLGYQFLRHIERTKVLLHMVDLSVPDALENYYNIRKELEKYSKSLSEKPEIIAGNKTDIHSSKENIEIFKKEFKEVCFISALAEKGLKPLTEAAWRKINESRNKPDER